MNFKTRMPEILRLCANILVQTGKAWSEHDAPRIGAALAYYTTFSMAPILIIAIALAGTFFGEEAARGEVSQQIHGLFGTNGAKAVEEMISSAHRGSTGLIATVIGVFTLLVGATSVFVELHSALNLVWGVPAPRKMHLGRFLRGRLLSFAMVLVVGFLLIASLFVSAGLAGFKGYSVGLGSSSLSQSINIVLSVIVTTLLFSLVFKVLPDTKIAWRDVLVGAFVTSALFTVGKHLIGIYLGRSSLSSTYGAAGSFVMMLVWIYYSAQIVLFGAFFTEVFARRRSLVPPLDLRGGVHHSDTPEPSPVGPGHETP